MSLSALKNGFCCKLIRTGRRRGSKPPQSCSVMLLSTLKHDIIPRFTHSKHTKVSQYQIFKNSQAERRLPTQDLPIIIPFFCDRLACAILIPCDIVRMSAGIKNKDDGMKDISGCFCKQRPCASRLLPRLKTSMEEHAISQVSEVTFVKLLVSSRIVTIWTRFLTRGGINHESVTHTKWRMIKPLSCDWQTDRWTLATRPSKLPQIWSQQSQSCSLWEETNSNKVWISPFFSPTRGALSPPRCLSTDEMQYLAFINDWLSFLL